MSKIKCNKCNNTKEFSLTELWKEHRIVFDYNNGHISSSGYKFEGRPYKVKSLCLNCGHEWTLRGISSITEITNKL